MEAARFERVFATNITGAFLCAREAVRRMSTRHGGKGGGIVNVSSAASRLGSPGEYVDYAASKGAVHALVKWLSRNAVGRGVLVNAVAPGPVETPMTRGFNLGPTLPMGRPEELAWPIAFLCTPAASYLSGAILDVNGGAFVGP